MKISLCMIVGNVEEYIGRCLKSFAPIADEICLVRAIGNQAPDKTYDIALALCNDLGIPLRFSEYRNAAGHDSWPHVDNFAAARQMSFDLASGEYCFWCDSDDVRELANRGGYSGFVFPYNILGKGMAVPRERMVLRGCGRWRCAVHEYFEFTIKPPTAIEDSQNRQESTTARHRPSAGVVETRGHGCGLGCAAGQVEQIMGTKNRRGRSETHGITPKKTGGGYGKKKRINNKQSSSHPIHRARSRHQRNCLRGFSRCRYTD